MDKLTRNNFYKEPLEGDIAPPIESEAEAELRKTVQRQKKTMFRLREKINQLRIACIVLIVILVLETIILFVKLRNNFLILGKDIIQGGRLWIR